MALSVNTGGRLKIAGNSRRSTENSPAGTAGLAEAGRRVPIGTTEIVAHQPSLPGLSFLGSLTRQYPSTSSGQAPPGYFQPRLTALKKLVSCEKTG